MARIATAALALALAIPSHAEEPKTPGEMAESRKVAEDPTKISTKAGLAYSDELSTSGSFAMGAKFKFNARVAKSGQWSIGASYLLPVAIVTFAAGKGELDTGVKQTRYSLGGFVPLNRLGLKTGKWLLFVPFGYTHTNSRQPVTDLDQQDGIPLQVANSSAYLGLFTIRPLGQRLSLIGGGNYTRGTHGYSGVAAVAGLSYHVTRKDTASLRASYVHNSFGQKQKVGVAYQHEF